MHTLQLGKRIEIIPVIGSSFLWFHVPSTAFGERIFYGLSVLTQSERLIPGKTGHRTEPGGHISITLGQIAFDAFDLTFQGLYNLLHFPLTIFALQ